MDLGGLDRAVSIAATAPDTTLNTVTYLRSRCSRLIAKAHQSGAEVYGARGSPRSRAMS